MLPAFADSAEEEVLAAAASQQRMAAAVALLLQRSDLGPVGKNQEVPEFSWHRHPLRAGAAAPFPSSSRPRCIVGRRAPSRSLALRAPALAAGLALGRPGLSHSLFVGARM